MWLAKRKPGPERSPKRQVLDAAGYEYELTHEMFVNWKARKIFSWEFVDEHTVEELSSCVNVDPSGPEWRYYFNTTPGPSAFRNLQDALELK
jgi:hypothetical protein